MDLWAKLLDGARKNGFPLGTFFVHCQPHDLAIEDRTLHREVKNLNFGVDREGAEAVDVQLDRILEHVQNDVLLECKDLKKDVSATFIMIYSPEILIGHEGLGASLRVTYELVQVPRHKS